MSTTPNRDAARNAMRQYQAAQEDVRRTQLSYQIACIEGGDHEQAVAEAMHQNAVRDVMHWAQVQRDAYAAVSRGAA